MQTEKTAEYIIDWLKSYAIDAHMDGFIVGISGGIDSAVTSALCASTGMPTLCVEMPIHQAPSQVSRGREHIDFLNKKYSNVSDLEVDLTSVFDEFKAQLPPTTNETSYALSLANTRSRLRMTALYYFAGINRYLVTGTGNKIEDFGVGFFTKYGDGGVDINPLGDLMKSEVYLLGELLEIPESIMRAAPTDGLFGDSRTDEDQLGASYDELEWAMKMVEQQKSAMDFTGRRRAVLEIYERLHRANLHKMNPIPICVIPKTFK